MKIGILFVFKYKCLLGFSSAFATAVPWNNHDGDDDGDNVDDNNSNHNLRYDACNIRVLDVLTAVLTYNLLFGNKLQTFRRHFHPTFSNFAVLMKTANFSETSASFPIVKTMFSRTLPLRGGRQLKAFITQGPAPYKRCNVIMFRQVFYECIDVSFVGRDNSVGIAARYRLDGPGI